MDNLEFLEVFKSIEKLDGETSDEVVIKSIKVVDLEELKEVHAQELKTNAQMLAEDHIVLHVNHVHDIIWVIFFQEVEDLQLDPRLVCVLLLVFNNLECNLSLCLVVKAFQCLTEVR